MVLLKISLLTTPQENTKMTYANRGEILELNEIKILNCLMVKL